MRIFLSYRRQDSADFTSRCFQYFTGRFGRQSVFWDVASIPPDRKWQDIIRREIEASHAVLVVVGPEWTSILQERLNSKDHVRFEIEHAQQLRRPIVVVRFGGADAPRTGHLPESLQFLAAQQVEMFDASNEAESLQRLENRLLQFAPAISGREAWTQASLARRPWFDDRIDTPQIHPAWWDLYNLHEPDKLEQVTRILSGESAELGPVLLAGAENSGRRYLVDAAVRRIRRSGQSLQLLRINLDGYEVDQRNMAKAYIQQQARRFGIDEELGLAELLRWLERNLGDGMQSINTCASIGMLLDLTGSIARVHKLLEGTRLAPGVKPTAVLLVALLERFSRDSHVVLHVDESVVPFTLREDLISFSLSLPTVRLVFSTQMGSDSEYLSGTRKPVRIDIPTLTREQLEEWLRLRFDANPVPAWLPRLLWQASQGNRGLVALQLIELFQESALDWDEKDHWRDGVSGGGLPPSTPLTRLLLPLGHLFQRVPTLEELLRLGALCGELVPMTLLMRFLRLASEEQDELMDLVDDELCANQDPLFEDLGFHHPGLSTGSHVNVYRFRSPLDSDLLLLETTPAWRETQAAALLEYFEQTLPAATRAAADIYLRLCRFPPANSETVAFWTQRLQWWISQREGERLREHITRALDSGRLAGESVWQAIQSDLSGGTAALKLNLLNAYERQKDGIPVQNLRRYYSIKGIRLYESAQFAEAEYCLREALRIAEAEEGPRGTGTATALNNLAQLFQATNRLAEAESLLRRVVDIFEANDLEKQPNYATALNNLAGLFQATNRLAEAEPLMRRALAIDEQFYGTEHPNVAIGLNNLAGLFQATNRLPEAEPLMRRALAILEQSNGAEHPDVATCLSSLAALLLATNRLPEAEPLMRRALAIDEQSYGGEHPKVARDLNNLALLLQATNRLAEAEPLMRRALAILEQSNGAEHPDVAICLSSLAVLLRATNRLPEAEPLLRRAVDIFEANDPEKQPNYATALNNLAQLLQDTNRLAEAEPLLRRAVDIFEANDPEKQPNYPIALNNLALLLQDTDRLAEAEPLMRRALEIFRESLGDAHPNTQAVQTNCTKLLAEMNN